MISGTFENITLDDLQSLVANSVSEGRDLEFKRDLPGNSDAEVKEFLADVTSLANAQGGDLLFGVEDTAGTASAVPGVSVADPDAAILRIENMIRDGVEPRLSGLRVRWIEVGTGLGVVVLRAPASLTAPHRVRFKNSGRFYSRNSRGKYEMDTHELRIAFTASEQLPARFRALHEVALANARGTDMPFRINADPYAVASIMPLGLFREARSLPVTPENALAPVRPSGAMDWMVTLEGALLHTSQTADNRVRSYALTHRTGRTDAAWTIGGKRTLQGNTTAKLVWPANFEPALLDMARSTAAKLATFGVDGPWVVLASVLDIAGHGLVLGNHELSDPAWRNGATLPDLVVHRLDEESLAPIFRSFWLLFGVERPATRAVAA